MNPELILSFFVMQGLAPAGTTVPVEAVLNSADAMPAWARFTFQVHLVQRLEEELIACKKELAELKRHHAATHAPPPPETPTPPTPERRSRAERGS